MVGETKVKNHEITPAGSEKQKKSDKTDLGSIMDMVLSKDPSQRKKAACSLAEKEHFRKEYIGILKRLIKDEKEEVWKVSSLAMGKFASKSTDAYEYIMNLVSDDYFLLQKRGISALGELAKYDHRGLTQLSYLISTGRKEITEETVKVLGDVAEYNEKAFKILAGCLRSREELIIQPTIRSMGILAKNNEDALNELIPFLSEEKDFIRLWTASAIGDAASQNESALTLYRDLISEEDVYLRRGFSKGLANFSKKRPNEALKLIREAVNDTDRYVRINAASALGMVTSNKKEAFAHIQELLEHEKGDVRRGAAEALLCMAGEMPDATLILLKKLVDDEDYYLRSIAALASVKIAGNSSEDAIGFVKTLADDKDEYVRRDVAYALGEMPKEVVEESYTLLVKLFEDRESIVRRETIKSLRIATKSKTQEVVDLLSNLTDDFDEGVRINAASVLGDVAYSNAKLAFDHLRRLAKDESPKVWEKVAMSLEKIFDCEPERFFDRIRMLQKEGINPEILRLSSKWAKNEDIARAIGVYYKFMSGLDETNIESNLGKALEVLDGVFTLKYAEDIRIIFKTFLYGIKCRNINDIALIKFQSEPVKTIYRESSQMDLWIYRVLEVIPDMALRYKQIEGLGDKHIYLGKMLGIIDSITEDLQKENYPETPILTPVLHSWRGVITLTMNSLKGRSNLKIMLRTRKVLPLDSLTLLLGIDNAGESLAENLEIEIMASPSYQIIDKTKKIDVIAHDGKDAVEFRIKPNEKRDFRVKFEITFDDFEMKGKSIYFADMVTFIDVPHEFRYIPNPYITGGPIKPNSKEMFFGRDDVFDFIKNNLSSISQKNVLILQGERRTGKTSILYRLPNVLDSEYLCVFLDGQEFGKTTLEYLFYRMSKLISSACESKGISICPPSREAFKKDPWYVFKDQFLEDLSTVLGERYLVILFDEFEALELAVTNGTLDDAIFDYIRNLMQHEDRIVFIFAGLHRLEEMMQNYWSVMFNIALYWKISFLSENEARKLIAKPVEGYNMFYDDLAIEKIIRATACHPYFVQLLCRFLVNRHNTEKRNYITVQDVNEELENVVEKAKPHFNYVWALSSPIEKMMLSLLPEILRKKTIATLTDILKECQEHKLDIPRTKITAALRSLMAKDIFERVSNQEVHYRFKIDFIRMWVDTHQPLERVIEELGDELR